MTTIDQIAQFNESPLISVVMPYWRNLPYVRDAVGSVVTQTFIANGGRLELIIIDDGSPEREFLRVVETVESLTHYDNWPKSIDWDVKWVPHRGKNRVLEASKSLISRESIYTFIADSDDVFAPNFVQVLFDSIETERARDRRVVMVYCDSILIDERGFCVGIATAPDFDRDSYFKEGSEESNYIPGNTLVLTETFRRGKPKDLDASQRDKWLRHTAELGKDGIAVRVKDPQGLPVRNYFYRQHKDQMSGHKRQLEADPRYGEKGFFALWPEDVRKPHWREWLVMPKDQQLWYLSLMPHTDTKAWNHYPPNPIEIAQ